MAMSHIETARTLHRCFNDRDWAGALKLVSDDFVYHDLGRNLEFRGKQGFQSFLEGWTQVMSDARVTQPTYVDAGDGVLCQFVGRGTQDGPIAGLPPTGEEASLNFCEIMKFDKTGKVDEIRGYWDTLHLFVQLGHLQPPRAMTEPSGAVVGGPGAFHWL